MSRKRPARGETAHVSGKRHAVAADQHEGVRPGVMQPATAIRGAGDLPGWRYAIAVSRSTLTGIVLAGGYSERFGADKARIIWRGRELCQHVAERMRSCAGSILFVVREDQRGLAWPGDAVVCDDPALPPGPMRGIATGLMRIETEMAAVAAVDCPLLNPRLYLALASSLVAADAGALSAVPAWDGRLQPLVAVYRRDASKALLRAIERGERSLSRALAALDSIRLSEAWCRAIDPAGASFSNINTADDLARLELTAGSQSSGA
ncbi:MAG TPA: molybdenum cofactor guanylyltransferase [Firmicutes bacterium]|nr:molybdenum cofactor guanylyltransferase [Bacillota bacterium]